MCNRHTRMSTIATLAFIAFTRNGAETSDYTHNYPRGHVPTEITSVHPVLMARDVPTSVDFFARLGFAVMFQDDATAPRYAAVRRGPVELHLQWADANQWAHPGDRPAYRFPTPDVDALYAEMVAAGAISQGSGSRYAAPADTPWGTREFHRPRPRRERSAVLRGGRRWWCAQRLTNPCNCCMLLRPGDRVERE